MNKIKEKLVYSLIITSEEEKIMLESLEKGISSVAWTIIKDAYDRKDFNKR